LDYGDFAETGLSVGATGNTFHAADFLFSGTVGWKYNDQTLVGGTVKYAYSVIGDYSGAAAAVDLGVAYDPRWKDIKLGMTVRNLGKQTDKFGSSSFPLPTEIVIGGSRRLQHMPLTLNVAAQFAGAGEGDYELSFLPSKPTVSFSVGGEFAIKPVGAKNPLHLRLGYQSRADALHVGYQNDLIAGFSLGFGMVVSKFNIDYVYAPMGAVGDVHRFGIMFAY